MKYTSEDVRRDAEEYREWARERDREQFVAYINWLRDHRQYIKKEQESE